MTEQQAANTTIATAAQHEAQRVAIIAHEDYFDSRRGIFDIEPGDTLVFWYDNNPFRDASIRPAHHSAVLAALALKGIVPVARAGFGQLQENGDHYTLVHAFVNGDGVEDAIADAVDRMALVGLGHLEGAVQS